MGINFKESQASLEQASAIASDLEKLLKQQEDLISGTKAAASHAKESQVLLELAKLPVDRLKDATEETVRIETLRKYGFTNVASIYNSSAIQLERIPGITLSAAQSLKALADQMYQAVAQSISYGFDIDDLTRADTDLIENLQGLDYLRAATKNSTSKMKPIAQTLRNSLTQTQPLNSRFRWFFTGSKKKEWALNALQEITYLVGEPVTIALVEAARFGLDSLEKRSPQPVEEFKKRSSAACADFGEQVRNIVWDQWDKGHGVGRGIYSVNDCDPDCADGTFHETPVTVELGDVTKVGSKYFLNTFSFVSKNGEALGVGKGSSGTWDISEFYRMVPGMHEGA